MADRTFTVSVPMRDGVGLATNIALPAGSGTFPAVLLRTPYGKGRADGQQAGLYADAGYALVVQDCRGRYDSEGQWFPVVNEANDGCDTVEWLAAQPWCNGRVGMVGASYAGIVQWAAASACPPHLRCIVPGVTPTDHYENWMYRGGANTAAGDGALSADPPMDEPADAFLYDPLDPVPTLGGSHSGDFAGIPSGPLDQRPVEGRQDVLAYTTPVLEQDLEVVGPITLHLSAASSSADTDFTGKLVDVHPDGRAMIVADGILRAGHRDPSPLKPDQAYEFQIGMGMTAISFPAGHRIRLEVSSSNFPRYSRNLNTGLDNGTSDQIISARQTVFHQRGKESWLELPVIPA